MTDATTPMRLSAAKAAWRGRCPRCGEGLMMKAMLEPQEQCGSCGQDFTAHAAGDGAVYIVMTLGCFIVIGLTVGLEYLISPPYWVQLVVAVIAMAGLIAGLLPLTKRFMIAQSIAMGAGVDQNRANLARQTAEHDE